MWWLASLLAYWAFSSVSCCPLNKGQHGASVPQLTVRRWPSWALVSFFLSVNNILKENSTGCFWIICICVGCCCLRSHKGDLCPSYMKLANMSCTLLVNHCVVAPVFSGVNRPALLHNFTAENSVVNLNWFSCASLTCIVGSGYLEDRKIPCTFEIFSCSTLSPPHTFSPYLYRGCVICNRYN